MHVSIISAYFGPQQSAGANRMQAYADCFLESGWITTVIAPSYGGCSDDEKSYCGINLNKEKYKFKIIRACQINESPKKFLARFLYETIKSIKLLYTAKRVKSDYYIVTTPYLSLLLLSTYFLDPRKLVIDVRDLTWQYEISKKVYVKIVQKILTFLSIRQLKLAHLVVTSTEEEKNYVLKKCPESTVILISNGLDKSTFNVLRGLKKVRNSEKVVFYGGTLGRAQGVEILADIAERMPDWKFRIAGQGSEFLKIKKIIELKKLSNIKLMGKISRSEVIDNYESASVLFIRLRRGFDTAIPSKIYEYIATGRQVLYMGVPGSELWKFSKKFKNIIFVQEDDAVDLERQLSSVHSFDSTLTQEDIDLISRYYIREDQVKKIFDHL
jgi:glycosyltransferase involved in cell wall biosynthesis